MNNITLSKFYLDYNSACGHGFTIDEVSKTLDALDKNLEYPSEMTPIVDAWVLWNYGFERGQMPDIEIKYWDETPPLGTNKDKI